MGQILTYEHVSLSLYGAESKYPESLVKFQPTYAGVDLNDFAVSRHKSKSRARSGVGLPCFCLQAVTLMSEHSLLLGHQVTTGSAYSNEF